MAQQNKVFISLCLFILFGYLIDYGTACNCRNGMCCSRWGYCGYGAAYCGDGCRGEACWNHRSTRNNGHGQLSGSNHAKTSWYHVHVGTTACGTHHSDNDYIAALNSAQFSPLSPNGNGNRNPLCNRRIRVNGPRGSIEVRIVDNCPGCPYGGLDLSPAAFQAVIGDLGIGIGYVSWSPL